ncbi:hypothetical protein NFC81_06400 [Salinispirillum sp. LH 10-3-1]|uniref:Uncharacterized protein n=1 Tax=Salinispirillum sp. LH 10-3-1 TaxID=2952525 RepID=A0AB38YJ19_9GAMM
MIACLATAIAQPAWSADLLESPYRWQKWLTPERISWEDCQHLTITHSSFSGVPDIVKSAEQTRASACSSLQGISLSFHSDLTNPTPNWQMGEHRFLHTATPETFFEINTEDSVAWVRPQVTISHDETLAVVHAGAERVGLIVGIGAKQATDQELQWELPADLHPPGRLSLNYQRPTQNRFAVGGYAGPVKVLYSGTGDTGDASYTQWRAVGRFMKQSGLYVEYTRQETPQAGRIFTAQSDGPWEGVGQSEHWKLGTNVDVGNWQLTSTFEYEQQTAEFTDIRLVLRENSLRPRLYANARLDTERHRFQIDALSPWGWYSSQGVHRIIAAGDAEEAWITLGINGKQRHERYRLDNAEAWLWDTELGYRFQRRHWLVDVAYQQLVPLHIAYRLTQTDDEGNETVIGSSNDDATSESSSDKKRGPSFERPPLGSFVIRLSYRF